MRKCKMIKENKELTPLTELMLDKLVKIHSKTRKDILEWLVKTESKKYGLIESRDGV
jgi:hypothetical protein